MAEQRGAEQRGAEQRGAEQRGTVPSDPGVVLREAGLRVTAPRVAVLDALTRAPHSDVESLTRAVRARLGAVSTQAVYDVLAALARAGLVRRVEPAGRPARYETRVGDAHHHVVCRGCGRVADVDRTLGAAPCLEPTAHRGFVIDEAEVTFWGLCPECRESYVRTVPDR